ncbi:butyrate kinase [Lutispora saccharofermentans]|uniref:Probable butyrate kinase n=1 Tax=Lutispora saccharofermentans TaxID=3024236 RepID=A0ABT1NJV1_9FIRM|nr:butyrate kinase [Lutispora saccharofermentans]MCQ1531508.1 butyrate kinase [Lutispora saccharofermentans]
MNREYILVINPGSTSTKVALFKDGLPVKQKNLSHPNEELEKFAKVTDQYDYRKDIILDWLKEEGAELQSLAAVVARGGLLRSIPGGTYIVTDAMIEDLKIGVQGEHASNLGGIIAKSIGDSQGIPSYIVDPVAVDEFEEVARISGMPELPRRSLVHALNIKAVARRAAGDMGKAIDEINMIIAHLGGGISVAPMKKGRIIDVNNASEGGPLSPDRTGTLPVGDLIRMCYSGKYTLDELKKKISGKGGLIAYLGTNDGREVEKMIANGDKKADLMHDAMTYQISKEIGAMAVVLSGDVQAVVLTGGLAYSKLLCERIERRVKFIAPFMVYPGEDEMLALAEGAARTLSGEEKPKIYEEEVK